MARNNGGVTRTFLDEKSLSAIASAAFGASTQLSRWDRLRGGSKKGVYRLAFAEDTSAVLYVWDDNENYWPSANRHDSADPFADANGLGLLVAANAALEQLDVRTPKVVFADDTKKTIPADFAVVEDIAGPNLETLMESRPAEAESVLVRLGESLDRMRGARGDRIGKLGQPSNTKPPSDASCESLVLDRALRDLDEASKTHEALATASGTLRQQFLRLAESISPRRELGLVHGELDPSHVLVDSAGLPVLIDIEGLMYFDVEWEHAFLEFRFGEHYAPLQQANLDAARMSLYRMALHLSLVAGPLRLLVGDFPDRDRMQEIVDWNLQQLLSLPS